jgi:hypothetical protein
MFSVQSYRGEDRLLEQGADGEKEPAELSHLAQGETEGAGKFSSLFCFVLFLLRVCSYLNA